MDGMDSRLDGMDNRLDGMDSRPDGMDTHLNQMNNRLEKVESQVSALRAGQIELRKEIKEVDIKVALTYQLALDAWGTSTENRKWLEEGQITGMLLYSDTSFYQKLHTYPTRNNPNFLHLCNTRRRWISDRACLPSDLVCQFSS